MSQAIYDPENPVKSPTPVIPKDNFERKTGNEIDKHERDDAISQIQDDFFGAYMNGQPINLFYSSESIQTILAQITRSPKWKAFRDSFQNVAEKCTGIQNMVCLGLGFHKVRPQEDNPWITQYAVFVYMWQVMNEKRRKECEGQKIEFSPVKRYFQDPMFDLRTKYLLQRVPRNTDEEPNIILEHPEAEGKIDKQAFVYAIHLPARYSVHFLSLGAQIYIGDKSDGFRCSWPRAMIETFIEESIFTNTTDSGADCGPEMNKVLAKIELCRQMYDEELSESIIPSKNFAHTSIYRRKG